MRIFYTTKRIFWSNEGQDYLESTQFNEFFINQWIELPNVKSINWTSHYEASFYATDAFDATYFKIEKNNQTYYFFVQDIKNDSANGKFWYLTLDLYNTYGKDFISQMRVLNPKVTFRRKHANRFFRRNNQYYFNFDRQRYLLTPPASINELVKNVNTLPKKQRVAFDDAGTVKSVEHVVFGGSQGLKSAHEFNFVKSYWGDSVENAVYEYVILKRPGNVKYRYWKWDYNLDFYYLTVLPKLNGSTVLTRINDVGSTTTSPLFGYDLVGWLDKIPSSLIVARIKTAIPPIAFKSCDMYGYVYDSNDSAIKDKTYCLSGIGKTKLSSVGRYRFLNINYSAPYKHHSNEPILGMSPFLKITMKQNEISPLCFFENISTSSSDSDKWKPIDGSITFDVVTSSSIFIKPPKGALNDDQVQKYIEVTHTIPVYGDVLNEYLLNNTNAINTGIQNKVGSAVLSGIGGLINVGGSIASGNISGALQGAVGIGQSIWGVTQSYKNLSATYADLGNRTDDLKDTYGKGACVDDEDILAFVVYELPEYAKQLVFKDIYFSGYLYNGVDNFISYYNRTNFNYFEVADMNQYLNLYTNYPKQIINDLSEKFLNGIRLWSTTNVKFDMSIDNREISFD